MILTALALLAAAPQACAKTDVDLPRDLAGWTQDGATLDTRHSTRLDAGHGSAETRMTIHKAGTFAIAVDQQAWVDIFPERAGKALHMASESKGPACSSIRKIVRYRLDAGTYRVAVTKVGEKRVKLMLVHQSNAAGGGTKRGRFSRRQST